MNGSLESSVFFGAAVSLISYGIGVFLNKKTGFALFNPLLVSVAATILIISLARMDYEAYNYSAKYISYLLTPATVCLAVPLYEKLELLKRNFKAVIIGISSGVLTSLLSIALMAVLFNFSRQEYVTFLPKSITTAIGIGISEELGGHANLTAAVIIITGIIGNISGKFICKLFRITEPAAVGVALGTSAHAMGTAKAMELGDAEGAMSSLSIVVSGILTVIGSSFFSEIPI